MRNLTETQVMRTHEAFERMGGKGTDSVGAGPDVASRLRRHDGGGR